MRLNTNIFSCQGIPDSCCSIFIYNFPKTSVISTNAGHFWEGHMTQWTVPNQSQVLCELTYVEVQKQKYSMETKVWWNFKQWHDTVSGKKSDVHSKETPQSKYLFPLHLGFETEPCHATMNYMTHEMMWSDANIRSIEICLSMSSRNTWNAIGLF